MLSDRELRLIRLFSAIVLGSWDEVRTIRREAPAGEPDRAWREAVLMVHLFAGFPRTIEAFDHLSEEGGLGVLETEEALIELDQPDRGHDMFEVIYGQKSVAVRDHLHSHHPDLIAWVMGHVYGRVLTRPGLSAAMREILAVTALASLGQDRQLASHARGAVRCGAEVNDLDVVIDHLSPSVPLARRDRARTVVKKFARRA